MQEGFVHEAVQLTCNIRLDEEEEELLGRYRPQGRTDNSIWRVSPNFVTYEIAIPGDSRYDSDDDEYGRLIPVTPGNEGVVDNGEYSRKGDGEL